MVSNFHWQVCTPQSSLKVPVKFTVVPSGYTEALAGPVIVTKGGVVSSVQVTVRVTSVAALPHASETFHLRVWERPQVLVLTTASVVAVGVPTPQLSVAVAVPRATSIWVAVGLQPRAKALPFAEITGGVLSSVQVAVRVTSGAALPHASDTFHLRVCERPQVLLFTTASVVAVGVPTPQLSVGAAVKTTASVCVAAGLRPRG